MNFKVNNPLYWKALEQGFSTWGKVSEITIPYPIELKTILTLGTTTINLKDNQKEVFNAVKSKSTALVSAKTSFGKSVVLIALHQAWGGKTLVVVHNKENLLYIHNQFKKFAGIETGILGNGKNILKEVTVTTLHSFRTENKWNELVEYGFDNLILDEADVMFTLKMIDKIVKFPKKRLLGLTGTTETEYDTCRLYHSPPIPALERFYQYTFKAKYDENRNPIQEIYYTEYIGKKYNYPPSDWKSFREELNDDIERKKAMLSFVTATRKKDSHILILFDRINDVEIFYKSAQKRGIKCFMSYGSQPKKEREAHMEEFQEKGGLLFAVYSTVGRGWDCPPLTKVYILFPLRKSVTLQQIIGRAMRWLEGKQSYIYMWKDTVLSYQFHSTKKKNHTETIKKHYNKVLKKI